MSDEEKLLMSDSDYRRRCAEDAASHLSDRMADARPLRHCYWLTEAQIECLKENGFEP